MHRIKTFLARVRTMSFRRMFRYAALASRESGRARLIILIDMAICAFRYGIGYLDYHTFGFAHLKDRHTRSTFMTMNDNLRLIAAVNNQDRRELFENKLLFDRAFPDAIGRAFLGLEDCSEEEFRSFAAGKGRIFVKTLGGFGGLGVKAVDLPEDPEQLPQLLQSLRAEGYGLAEEAIRQHEGMSALCAASVNTIRMVTLIDGSGTPHLMYALVRMGMGSAAVDNISSGGMYSPLSAEGVITAPAFCDKTGETYGVHPASGTKLVGYQIPKFEEAKALVLKTALRIPDVRYVGWDVAISQGGPVLVEGNTIPSYDMCQNYRHLPADGKQGVKPMFRQILGNEISL